MSEETSKNMTFIQKLEYLMKRDNVTRMDVANGTGIPRSTIDNWFNRGEEDPKRHNLVAIAKFFDVSLYYLCVDTPYNSKENVKINPFEDVLEEGDVLAFHLDGIRDASELTEEEIEEVKTFIQFVKARRATKEPTKEDIKNEESN